MPRAPPSARVCKHDDDKEHRDKAEGEEANTHVRNRKSRDFQSTHGKRANDKDNVADVQPARKGAYAGGRGVGRAKRENSIESEGDEEQDRREGNECDVEGAR